MEQHVRIFQLLKRCLEGFDELVRKLADKADRIGDHDIKRVAHREQARGRVQRVEQSVVRRDACAGQRIEKRRLARVRIADDGDDGDLIFLPAIPLRRAHAAHLLKVSFKLIDLAVDVAAVGLKLRFTRTFRADRSLARGARLTLQMRPHTDKARQQVLILRQLHLKTALLRLCPLGEDIEDQSAAVKHLHAELLRQHTHLRRRQVIVKNDHARFLSLHELPDFRDLALADKGARIRSGQRLQRNADTHAAGSLDQSLQLFKAFLIRIFPFVKTRRA